MAFSHIYEVKRKHSFLLSGLDGWHERTWADLQIWTGQFAANLRTRVSPPESSIKAVQNNISETVCPVSSSITGSGSPRFPAPPGGSWGILQSSWSCLDFPLREGAADLLEPLIPSLKQSPANSYLLPETAISCFRSLPKACGHSWGLTWRSTGKSVSFKHLYYSWCHTKFHFLLWPTSRLHIRLQTEVKSLILFHLEGFPV